MQRLLEFANAFSRPGPRLAYSRLVITEEVEAELLRNFFPAGPGCGLVDLSVESPLPASWVNEIRRFFPQRCDQKQFFAVEDLMQCMYDVVACYCSKSELIQQFGNAKFRELLRQAFISATSKSQLMCCAEADSRLLTGGEIIINDAAQQLTSVELDKSARAPLVGGDAIGSTLTTADAVSEFEMLSEVRRVYNEGPLPLLQWDDDTDGLVDSIIGELFASGDPANHNDCTSPLAQHADHELHAAFLAHFSGRAFSRHEVRAELQFAASAVCLSYLGGPINAYLRRKLDSLYRGIAVSLPFLVPIPFPGLEQAPPFPADVASNVTRWHISFTSAQGTTHWLEFIQRNFHASFEPFLDRGEMPHVVGMYRERVATEHNRCFFIHLGAALGVHPVWLQVIPDLAFLKCTLNLQPRLQEYFRPRVRDAITSNSFCSDVHAGLLDPLLSVLRPGSLVEIGFLYSVWPDFLRGVRLLIVNVRGRLPNGQEAIIPNAWTVISDPRVVDPLEFRDIVLKLSGNHFTLLECKDPSNAYAKHPIGRLLALSALVGFPGPQEMGSLLGLLEPRNGIRPPDAALLAAQNEALALQAEEDFFKSM
jgi:hypothetical protein